MVKEDKNKKVKKAPSKTENKKNVQTRKNEPAKKVEPSKLEKVEVKEVVNPQEDSSYTKTILAAILIILVLIGGYIGFKIKNAKDEDKGKDSASTYVMTSDEKRFKDEYESLNGTARSNGTTNKTVSIIDDNNIQYVTLDQAADIMENGSGIIYFGFAACPWCRNAAPVLLNAMSNSTLDTIYYVDVRRNDKVDQDIRDEYTVENNKLVLKRKAASDRYYDILKMLDDYLDDYTVPSNGKQYKTGEKRIGAPSVVAVNSGEVVGFHADTLPGHNMVDGVLPDLTDEQIEELYNIYASMIQDYLGDSCTEDSHC